MFLKNSNFGLWNIHFLSNVMCKKDFVMEVFPGIYPIFSELRRKLLGDNFKKTFKRPLNSLYNNDPANIYLVKVNNRNTRKSNKICSKLTIKTPEQRQQVRSGAFIVNSGHI